MFREEVDGVATGRKQIPFVDRYYSRNQVLGADARRTHSSADDGRAGDEDSPAASVVDGGRGRC